MPNHSVEAHIIAGCDWQFWDERGGQRLETIGARVVLSVYECPFLLSVVGWMSSQPLNATVCRTDRQIECAVDREG